MIKNRFVLFTVIALFFSCGSSKSFRDKYKGKLRLKFDSKEKPDWIGQKPESSEYYTGINMVSKTQFPYSYVEKAKSKALADLISNISVNISSNSVMTSIEDNFELSEEFTSSIESSSKEEIEDYELVDTYESPIEYWVYYRLNKKKHHEIIREKQDKVSRKAITLMTDAINYEKKYDYKNALQSYISAIELIKPYWNSTLETVYNGENVFLGNELMKKTIQLISDIQILRNTNIIKVKRAQSIKNEASFSIKNKKGHDLNNLPIEWTYSKDKWIKNIYISKDGLISPTIDKVISSKDKEFIVARLDLDKIINEVSNDFSLRKIFSAMSVPEDEIRIEILMPKIYVESNTPILKEIMINFLNKKNIPLSDKKQSDFSISINEKIKKTGANNNGILHRATLDISYTVFNNRDKIFSTKEFFEGKSIENIERAIQDATSEAIDEFNYRIANRIYDIIFK
ncbi:LPP20 family lipoprotein [Ichthyobacterium seriolicida]|uniref:Lipoprotein n=1 Tax=Ichthyobacterium seriolicida TaxID=242600 RepID=A0A1J1DZG2_9FLAO|nr:LPP20 family lipoprotein [Ichthyobacterium seriolicida]BAV95303.1 hypothetical protein JBKA6_1290 [Ichthyobacterium seriolicida]